MEVSALIVAGKLVRIIEKNSDIIAENWADEVTSSPYTHSYRNVPRDDLEERADSVCRRMGYFLSKRLPRERLAAFYKNIALARRAAGYSVEEVVMALMLLKRHVWLFVLKEGLLTANLELYQALELNNRVVLYFDRAIYYVTLAWAEEDDREERGEPSPPAGDL